MSYLSDPEIPKIGLVVIGNEILTGRTQDTNTIWIAEQLMRHGAVLAEVRVVPDLEEKIIEAVNELRKIYAHVITTGGIGPTHDDITAVSIAKAFNVELILNEEAHEILERYYGAEDLTDSRLKMAYTPEGAELIPNPVSAAPGFIIDNVFVMAGVPKIMQAMLDFVLDYVTPGNKILSNTIACTLHESEIATELSVLQRSFNTIDIGSYPHFRGGFTSLSIVLRSTDIEDLKNATIQLLKIIQEKSGEPRALSLQVPVGDLISINE